LITDDHRSPNAPGIVRHPNRSLDRSFFSHPLISDPVDLHPDAALKREWAKTAKGMNMLMSIRRTGITSTLLSALCMLLVAPNASTEDVVASTQTPGQLAARDTAAGETSAAANPTDPTQVTMAVQANPPVAKIEAFHAGLIGIMKDAKKIGFQGRIDRLEPLMESTFDLDFMASKTVGGYWRKLSDADKQLWIKVFTRITVANYAGRFTGYTGEEFKTLGLEDAQRDQKMVMTKIEIPKDDDVELNYRLRKTDAGWRVIDVYLNGTVSELAMRRSEYSSALKREGFAELVASIETKIEDMKAQGLIDG
jgi:phospholipid transport system substrate-binding protein